MVEFREAGLVRSLTGHGGNELYIIISIQEEYVYLSDDGKRPLGKQKHENRRHLQLMGEHDETLRKKLAEDAAVKDEDIIGFIRSRKQQEVR